jgi:hypothetical protein
LLKTDFFAHYSEYINEEIQKENPKIWPKNIILQNMQILL